MVYWEQKIAKMYRIVFLLISSVFLLSCSEKKEQAIKLPYYNAPDFTPFFINDTKIANAKITHTISDFNFLDEDSIFISNKIIEGKIHVADFIFTRCGSICPIMTSNLKLVSDAFQKDTSVVLLSYSVTPWIDKPAVLKKYKKDNHIENAQWYFLTGAKADIYTLARTAYFAEEDIGFSKDSAEFLHTEHVLLIDKSKRIRGIYNGTLALEMQQLIEDIHTLKEEELVCK